ncbi:phosphopantetheine-binding protein, partial [Streptomyces sp. B-S-A8]
GVLESEGVTRFVELGPDAVLTAMAQQCLDSSDLRFIATLRRERPEATDLLTALGRLHNRGVAVDWDGCFTARGARTVPLPTYAFQRQNYWLATPESGAADSDRNVQGVDLSETLPAQHTALPSTERLAALPPAERLEAVADLVHAEVAVVLGYGDASALNPERTFQELGFTSLSAVELRDRLRAATGVRLTATAVYDHPTPAALVTHVHDELAPPAAGSDAASVLADLDRVEANLAALPLDEAARSEIAVRLQTVLEKCRAADSYSEDPEAGDALGSASVDEIFDFIDAELGESAVN